MSSPSHAHHAHAHAEQIAPSTAERAATWLSLACAVHCLVVPVAVSAMPLFGATGLAEHGSTGELLLTGMVVLSALLGVTWGYRRHRDVRVVVATSLGLVAYLVGHVLESTWYGVALAVLGALMLAASSFLGARLAQACSDASCAH